MNTPASSKGTLPGTTYPEVPRKPPATEITSDWRLLAWEPATNKVWSLIQQELVGALGGASYRTVRRSLFLNEYATGKLVAGRFSRITNRTGTRPTSDVLLFEVDKRKIGLALEIQADEKDDSGNVTAEGPVSMVVYTPANDTIKEVSTLTADNLLTVLDAAGSNVNFAVVKNKLQINAKKYTGELGIEVSEAGKISLQKTSPDYHLPPNPTVGIIATNDFDDVDYAGNPYKFKIGDVITVGYYGQVPLYLVSDFIPIEPSSVLTWPNGTPQYSMYYDADKVAIYEVGRYVYDHPGTPDDTTPPNAAFIRVSAGDNQDPTQAQIIYDRTTYSFGNLPYVRLVNGYAPDASGNVYTDYIPGIAYGLEYWLGDYRLQQNNENRGFGGSVYGYLNRPGLPEGFISYDPQSPYVVSGFVQIEPNTIITWRDDRRPKTGFYYDANTNKIAGIAQYKADTGTDLTPPNAYYMRVQFWRTDRDNPTPDKPADEDYSDNISYTPAAFPYVKSINGKFANTRGDFALELPEATILGPGLEKVRGVTRLTQSITAIFLPPAIGSGSISVQDGRVISAADTGVVVSDFIPIAGGGFINWAPHDPFASAYYDINKVFIPYTPNGFPGAIQSNKPVPANAAFMRIAGDGPSKVYNNIKYTQFYYSYTVFPYIKNIAIDGESAVRQPDKNGTVYLPSRSRAMTQAERVALSAVIIGTRVYQTDGDEGEYVFKSTGWKLLG
jgi:hypothetical protein